MPASSFTFDTFVVSERSRVAFAAAVAASENPGRVHNPLILYGKGGCGKSHLLAAIEHGMRQRHPAMKVLRMPAVMFVARITSAIRSRSMPAFQDEISELDAILLDDLPLSPDRTFTREEIFRHLADAVNRRAQVVATSMTPIEPHSLFATATAAEVGYPDVSARAEIARRAATRHHLNLPADALHRIAKSVESTPQVESAVARVAADAMVREARSRG